VDAASSVNFISSTSKQSGHRCETRRAKKLKTFRHKGIPGDSSQPSTISPNLVEFDVLMTETFPTPARSGTWAMPPGSPGTSAGVMEGHDVPPDVMTDVLYWLQKGSATLQLDPLDALAPCAEERWRGVSNATTTGARL